MRHTYRNKSSYPLDPPAAGTTKKYIPYQHPSAPRYPGIHPCRKSLINPGNSICNIATKVHSSDNPGSIWICIPKILQRFVIIEYSKNIYFCELSREYFYLSTTLDCNTSVQLRSFALTSSILVYIFGLGPGKSGLRANYREAWCLHEWLLTTVIGRSTNKQKATQARY